MKGALPGETRVLKETRFFRGAILVFLDSRRSYKQVTTASPCAYLQLADKLNGWF